MAQYIRIRNWDRFQYRTDRPLPWIKDYDSQLSDPEYTELSFAERGFLHDLRLLANRRGNRILNDPGYIRRMTAGKGPHTAQITARLIAKGFLEEFDSATETPANHRDAGALSADSGRSEGALDVDRDVDRDIPLTPFIEDPQTQTRNGRRSRAQKLAYRLAETLIRNGAWQMTDASLTEELTDRNIPDQDREPLLKLARSLRP